VNIKDENISSQSVVPGFGDVPAERRIRTIGNFLRGSSENTVDQFVSVARTVGPERNLSE
jgi:hypothetical protein